MKKTDNGTDTDTDNGVKFSSDEIDLLTALAADGPMTVTQLAAACWPGEKVQGDLKPESHSRQAHGRGVSSYRRALNAVRRPVRYGFVEKSARGTYIATARGKEWA